LLEFQEINDLHIAYEPLIISFQTSKVHAGDSVISDNGGH
jgi:hypothetical protein